MDYQFLAGTVIAVVGIVTGNLLLNGIKGNKKVGEETFAIFVEETRRNFQRIDERLAKIEEAIRGIR